MSNKCGQDIVIMGTSFAKSLPRTPISKSSPVQRKATSAPPIKHMLTPSSKSRLGRHRYESLRQGSPSPLPMKFKKHKEASLPEPLLSPSPSSSLTNEDNPRTSRSPSYPSTMKFARKRSDLQLNHSDEDPFNDSSHFSSKSNKFGRKVNSSAPSAWSAEENLILWKFVLSQGEGKFTWKGVCSELRKQTRNMRTVSGVQQHWASLKRKLEAVIEQISPKDDCMERKPLSSTPLDVRSKSSKVLKTASSSRKCHSRISVKEEMFESMDED